MLPPITVDSRMLFEHDGKTYSTGRGSDVARDGMFLWLSQAGSIETLLEVFYSDSDGTFTMAGFGGFVPLEVVERFIAEARACLPPHRTPDLDAASIEFTDEESLARILNEDSALARFADKAEESAYEQLDAKLIEQIWNVAEALHLSDGIYQIEDWWPNHLRGIESSPEFFRRDLLDRLQRLLVGDFAPWRIIIHYYEGPSNEDRGSALILSDRVVATSSLKKYLR